MIMAAPANSKLLDASPARNRAAHAAPLALFSTVAVFVELLLVRLLTRLDAQGTAQVRCCMTARPS